MSMCHLDGSIFKTDKSVLLKALEKNVQSKAPDIHRRLLNRWVLSRALYKRFAENFWKRFKKNTSNGN